jgi:hypothetical protein
MAARSPRTTAQLLKRLTPLLAAPAALLVNPGRADAVLTYNIFQDGPNVVLQASGFINQFPPTCCTGLSQAGIFTGIGQLGTGTDSNGNPAYSISGPVTIPISATANVLPSSSSGISTTLFYSGDKNAFFIIDASYTAGTEIISSSTFNTTTLAALGFTIPGLLGTWTIVEPNTPNTFDTIKLEVGPPAVPGPLPLLGVATAFGWSRRIATAKTPAAG